MYGRGTFLGHKIILTYAEAKCIQFITESGRFYDYSEVLAVLASGLQWFDSVTEALKNYGGDILLVGINYDARSKKHTCKIEKYRK